MVTEKQIIEAWAFLRTENMSLPDEVIDFVKDASLAILNKNCYTEKQVEMIKQEAYGIGVRDGQNSKQFFHI